MPLFHGMRLRASGLPRIRVPEIRQLRVGDIRRLRELLRSCWLDSYTGLLPDSVIMSAIAQWHSTDRILLGMSTPHSFYAGYFEDEVLLGMVSARLVRGGTVKVFQLYVHPSRQREGIGSKLMGAAIKHYQGLRRVVLEVEEGNTKGISFYRKLGFTYQGMKVVNLNGHEIHCLVGELVLPEAERSSSITLARAGHRSRPEGVSIREPVERLAI